MPSDSAQDLRRIALFRDLSAGALARLAAAGVWRSYKPGDVIIFQDEASQAAYFILEGLVRVYRLSPQGREQVLARLGPGQSFNIVPPFLDSGVNHATVSAISTVTLYAVPDRAFRRLVAHCPELAQVVLAEFAARLDHLTGLVESLSLHTVRGRLARFLLDHAQDDDAIERWTQEEIAAHVGTVRDMVNRNLRALADAELIRLERNVIVLLDRAGLEAEAEG
jgi:CRP-like cAMP-binding protein